MGTRIESGKIIKSILDLQENVFFCLHNFLGPCRDVYLKLEGLNPAGSIKFKPARQIHSVPEAGAVPLVCDMTSDLLTRPIDVSRFRLIYASAQKNLGVAGVTVLIAHPEILARAGCPATMLNYAQIAAYNSLLNTPPVFAIYLHRVVASPRPS